MTLDEIKALIEAMGSSDLAEMEVAKGGWTLRLVRQAPSRVPVQVSASDPSPAVRAAPAVPVGPPAPVPVPSTAVSPDVLAPLAGVVFLSPAPDGTAFVGVGQSVDAGAILCTIEAMKTFNEVRAERAGVIETVLVGGGDEVNAGQPLFRMSGRP